MFAGEQINLTEQRAVLHTALRAPRGAADRRWTGPVTADVHRVLDRLHAIHRAVRNGAWRGHTGKPITDIVNIGIGGSYLGPKMVCQALRPYATRA
jgi:glucose-6-phosphate isomerase